MAKFKMYSASYVQRIFTELSQEHGAKIPKRRLNILVRNNLNIVIFKYLAQFIDQKIESFQTDKFVKKIPSKYSVL